MSSFVVRPSILAESQTALKISFNANSFVIGTAVIKTHTHRPDQDLARPKPAGLTFLARL
jgi:hypothetical protein